MLAASAELTLDHVTFSGSPGIGVDANLGGAATITHTILWGNAGGDLSGVPCTSVSWSDVGSVDCTAVNDNLQVDPLFVGGGSFHLQTGSPCSACHPSVVDAELNIISASLHMNGILDF